MTSYYRYEISYDLYVDTNEIKKNIVREPYVNEWSYHCIQHVAENAKWQEEELNAIGCFRFTLAIGISNCAPLFFRIIPFSLILNETDLCRHQHALLICTNSIFLCPSEPWFLCIYMHTALHVVAQYDSLDDVPGTMLTIAATTNN
jgi:hypothetical protein